MPPPSKRIKFAHQSWWDSQSEDRKRELEKDPKANHLFEGDEPPAKKQAIQAEADSSQSSGASSSVGHTSEYLSPSGSSVQSNVVSGSGEPNIDAEMVLPGTGGEMASGGNNGGMEFEYKTPQSSFGTTESVYRKHHKFMTFGFASKFIEVPSGTPATIAPSQYLTTYLAEVPWHIPAFYMNQSEFDLLPEGAHATELRVTVTYRDRTIQFLTAATATSVATLNQKGDIAVAHGLNRTGWGQNCRYTAFDTTESMIPTAVTKPVYGVSTTVAYRGMVNDYYGTNNNFTDFTNFLPKHQLGRECFLYNYWCLNTRKAVNTTALFPYNMYGGIPNLAARIKQIDGKTVVNKVVAHSVYKPKMAPLKNGLKTYKMGLPWPKDGDSVQIAVQGNLVQSRGSTLVVTNNSTATTTDGQVSITSNTENLTAGGSTVFPYDIYKVIEKSQFIRSGEWGEQHGHIQPSLHIGIQPVPALSSGATIAADVFNSWTDNRAYFDVYCEMHVKVYRPTEFPWATEPNVPLADNLQYAGITPSINQFANYDGATVNGLYVQGIDNNLTSS